MARSYSTNQVSTASMAGTGSSPRQLKHITFHAALMNLSDRIGDLENLAGRIKGTPTPPVPKADAIEPSLVDFLDGGAGVVDQMAERLAKLASELEQLLF